MPTTLGQDEASASTAKGTDAARSPFRSIASGGVRLVVALILSTLSATAVLTVELSLAQYLTSASSGDAFGSALDTVGLFAGGSLLVFGLALPLLGLPLVWLTTRRTANGGTTAASVVAALLMVLGSLFVLVSGATAVAWLFVTSLALPGAAAGWILWRAGLKAPSATGLHAGNRLHHTPQPGGRRAFTASGSSISDEPPASSL